MLQSEIFCSPPEHPGPWRRKEYRPTAREQKSLFISMQWNASPNQPGSGRTGRTADRTNRSVKARLALPTAMGSSSPLGGGGQGGGGRSIGRFNNINPLIPLAHVVEEGTAGGEGLGHGKQGRTARVCGRLPWARPARPGFPLFLSGQATIIRRVGSIANDRARARTQSP